MPARNTHTVERRYNPLFVEAFRERFHDIDYDLTPVNGEILAKNEGDIEHINEYRSVFAAPVDNYDDYITMALNGAKRGMQTTLMLQADMMDNAIINGLKFAREIIFILQNPFDTDIESSIGEYLIFRFTSSPRLVSSQRNVHADMAYWDYERNATFNNFSIIRRFKEGLPKTTGGNSNGRYSEEMEWWQNPEAEALAEIES